MIDHTRACQRVSGEHGRIIDDHRAVDIVHYWIRRHRETNSE